MWAPQTLSRLREIEEYLRGSRPDMELGDVLDDFAECESELDQMEKAARRDKEAPRVTTNVWAAGVLRHVRVARCHLQANKSPAAAESIDAAIEAMEKALRVV